MPTIIHRIHDIFAYTCVKKIYGNIISIGKISSPNIMDPAIIGSDREARGHPQTTRRLGSWPDARKAATSTTGSPEEWWGHWEVTPGISGWTSGEK